MKSLSKALSTMVLVLSVGCVHAGPLKPREPVIRAAAQRQSVTVMLREPSGNQLGSGVLVGSAAGGYWVVSNRHVVQQQNVLCVVSSDRKVTAGFVLPPRRVKGAQELDLALLWIPRRSKEPLMVAVLAPQRLAASELPVVNSTGYPTLLQANPDGPLYSESEGLLLPLLKRPLEGGFDLAYTSEVQKGMSGGGVFSGAELIGINGAHAKPLWPGQWRDQAGKAVDDEVHRKLELVSLGISADVIKAELKAAGVLGTEQLDSLTGVDCNPARRQGAGKPAAQRTW